MQSQRVQPERLRGQWQVWAVAAPDAVIYQIRDGRSMAAAEAVLKGYSVVVICDGYAVYKALAKNNAELTLAHCWAHVRRELVETAAVFPEETTEVLDRIGELYAVEALCPKGAAGDAMRAELRNARSRGVIDQIKAWAMSTPTLGESALGKAIAYMTGLWSGVARRGLTTARRSAPVAAGLRASPSAAGAIDLRVSSLSGFARDSCIAANARGLSDRASTSRAVSTSSGLLSLITSISSGARPAGSILVSARCKLRTSCWGLDPQRLHPVRACLTGCCAPRVVGQPRSACWSTPPSASLASGRSRRLLNTL